MILSNVDNYWRNLIPSPSCTDAFTTLFGRSLYMALGKRNQGGRTHVWIRRCESNGANVRPRKFIQSSHFGMKRPQPRYPASTIDQFPTSSILDLPFMAVCDRKNIDPSCSDVLHPAAKHSSKWWCSAELRCMAARGQPRMRFLRRAPN